MRKLLPFAAPRRFVFQDPDTGYTYKALTHASLIEQILSYRKQNKLPQLEALNVVLENYWCGLVENTGKCTEVKLKRGWLTTLKGGVAVLENVFFGEDNMVQQSTAESRAAICVTCPKNIFPDKGPFVKWCDSVAEAMVGDRKTPMDAKLGSCEVCSCVIRAKVHYGGNMKLSEDEIKQLPDFCWMHEENKTGTN